MRKRLTVTTKHASYETIKSLYTSEKISKIKTRFETGPLKSTINYTLIGNHLSVCQPKMVLTFFI